MADTALTKALEYASTSLASLDYLEALTCFCFEPGKVYAFDDVTSTMVKVKHNIHGGVRGEVLQRLLAQATNGFTLTQKEEVVWLKDSRTKVKLPLLSPDYFLLSSKPEIENLRFMVGPEFFESLDWASNNVLGDTYEPALAGVTLHVQENRLRMYAFDFAGLLRSTVKIARSKGEEEATLIIPVQCANRARRIYTATGRSEPVEIRVGPTTIRMLFENGLIELTSKLVNEVPVDFEELSAPFTVDVTKFPVPEEFHSALEQCLIVSGDDKDHLSRFITAGKEIRVICDAVHGKVDIRVPTEVELPEDDFHFSPKVLSRKIGVATSMSFSVEQCKAIHFYHPRMKFVVGSVDEPEVTAKLVQHG